MKILLTDCATLKSKNDLSLDVLKQFGETVEFDNIDRKTLLREVADTDILLCNKTIIDKEVMNCAKRLQYIGLFATGYNNIDIDTAKELGITVCNAGSYSTYAVVQQVFGFILAHYTKISEYNQFVKDGGWKNAAVFSPLVFPTDEIFGKTIGIIGYGSIGKAVEKAAIGFGMKVLVHTRTVPVNSNTEFVSLDQLLSKSDIVTLHCPLNSESADMMNRQSFSKMKDGAFFINTSRGGTVDEQALFDALESGKLSGAGIDVLKQEPMSNDCILCKAKNIMITPHTSWAPLATRNRLLAIVVSNIKAYLDGNPTNCVTK